MKKICKECKIKYRPHFRTKNYQEFCSHHCQQRYWRRYNNQKCRNYSIRWRRLNPEKRRDGIFKTHNLLKFDYDKFYKRQKGVCAICGEKETRKAYNKVVSLSIDHNHKTGEVRGLLCCKCNYGIGLFNESKEKLQNAIYYLYPNERMR
jgi:hypothetical protein